jgi:DNA-binding HxlR family transcriptional regulator/putative sterol carrier protein
MAMTIARTYGDQCGISRALDRVGERWALLIVRELLVGPKRFTDLRTGLPTASPNVLSQRLRELESFGVVRRRRLPPPAASQVYELTAWGRELEPVAVALGRWGARAPLLEGDDVWMSLDSHVVSLRTLFDPERAGDLSLRLELRLGEQSFRAEVRDRALTVEPGEAQRPDVTVACAPGTLIELIHGWRDLDAALAVGAVTLEGDRAGFERFLGLFPMPEPAELPTA